MLHMLSRSAAVWSLLLLIGCCTALPLYAYQSRNTLWLDGLGTMSKGWGIAPQVMQLQGYDLVDLIGDELPYTIYQPWLGVEETAQELAGHLAPYDDVMVLAHDYGGLVARQLANISDNVSALVLLGVPNYGSGVLEWAVKPLEEPEGKSEARVFVDQLKVMKQAFDCEGDCALIESFDNWLGELTDSPHLYAPMFPESPVLDQLNQNPGSVPYVVIYGTVEDYSLSGFLNAFYFSNLSPFGNIIGDCEAFLSNVKKLRRKRALIKSVVSSLNGFLNNLKKSISGISADSPDALVGAVSSILQQHVQLMFEQIDAIAKYHEEVAKDMRCLLLNKYLESEWLVHVLSDNSVNLYELAIWVPSYSTCYSLCTEQFPSDPYEAFYDCLPACLGEEPVYAYVIEDKHDGLLSRAEQVLEGAQKVYHLPQRYHFVEPRMQNGSLLNDILVQIFEGDAGPAFVVPKE